MGFFRSLFDGQHGLVYANVRAYFTARGRGEDHRGALKEMINSRYRGADSTRERVMKRMEDSQQQGDTADDQLRTVIHLMHTLELGLPADFEVYTKFQDELDEVIAQHKRKHPGAL